MRKRLVGSAVTVVASACSLVRYTRSDGGATTSSKGSGAGPHRSLETIAEPPDNARPIHNA